MRPHLLPPVLAAALLTFTACQTDPKPQGRPGLPPPPPPRVDVTAKDYTGPALPRATVRGKDAFGGPFALSVEVAANAESRERGLMWRTSLQDSEGMLFVFPEVVDHSFWMKNTLIPLDMLFLGAAGEVVGVVENAAPQTLEPRGVGRPSGYVLEVPGGWAARHGVTPGTPLQLLGVAGVNVGPEGR